MSNGKPEGEDEREETREQGPNLAVVYGLLGAALVIALGIAALIVLPFYRHH